MAQGLALSHFLIYVNRFLTTKLNGLGLGLSISQQILASMNGKLCAHNREQGGARFSLCLPITSYNTEPSKG